MTLYKHRYGYDADGRVTNVTVWEGHAWTFTRDAAGRMTALDYPAPSGVSGAWTHDVNHKVSGWSYNNGSPIAGAARSRDAVGVTGAPSIHMGLAMKAPFQFRNRLLLFND